MLVSIKNYLAWRLFLYPHSFKKVNLVILVRAVVLVFIGLLFPLEDQHITYFIHLFNYLKRTYLFFCSEEA